MAINKKLLEFQKLGIALNRTGVNPHFNSNYVTLNEVLEKIKEPLNKLGILILQTSEVNGLRTVLQDTEDDTKLECFMPYTETSTAQKLGSNLTYLRRYSLITMLGLGDEDDDGNHASTPTRSQTPKSAPQRTEVPIINQDTPMGLICDCGLAKKRVQTKKPGPNQGRYFYTCPKPRGQECPNSFQWEDDGDVKVDIEGERSDYGKSGEYEGGYDGDPGPIPQ